MGGRYGTLAHDSQNWVVEVRDAHVWRTVNCRSLHTQYEAMRYIADYTRPNYPQAQIRTRQAFDAEPERKFFVRWGDTYANRGERRPTDYQTASEQYRRARSKFNHVELVAVVPNGEKVIASGGQRRSAPANTRVEGEGGKPTQLLQRPSKELSNPPKGRATVTKRP